MSKLFIITISAAFLITAAGCNTFKGAGQDVENAGKNIKKAVERND